MTDQELAFASIEQLSALIRKKKLSPVDLTNVFLARIERLNPQLNAYLTVTAEQALAQARQAEKEICAPRSRARYRGPLHGIPISLKDNIYTAGIRTTAGSKILAHFVPDADAPVARRLRKAGAILLGKTNLHEFAYGVTTDNPHYGAAHNPWDTARIPGGSSGGSAAAVAAGLCVVSIGTDTGGSIRIPASLCGIVGLKPNYARVSLQGIVPLSKSLDHAGPLARSVADAGVVLNAIGIDHPRNQTTPSGLKAVRLWQNVRDARRPLGRIILGRPREYFWEGLDEEVRRLVDAAIHEFEKLGAAIAEVSLPRLHEADAPSTSIALAEARAFHEAAGWFPARASEYGEDVRKRLEAGADVRASDYLLACEFRSKMDAEWLAAFRHPVSQKPILAQLVPAVPMAAPRIGEDRVRIGEKEVTVRGALLRLNRPANYGRIPALSIPCGFTRAGLPVGLQLIGMWWDEARLLRLASLYEQHTAWHKQHPPCSERPVPIPSGSEPPGV